MSLLIRRAFTSLSKSLITKEHFSPQVMIVHAFHNNQILYNRRKKASSDISLNYFNASKSKEKEVFLEIIRIYLKENTLLRGHTQFILKALKYMNEFGVNKDLETYKALLDVFPKGKFIPVNIYQAMSYHYPKQQDTAIELLAQMEDNFVMPDYEMQQMILNIFGERSYVIKKFWRMTYWMSKFAHLNPWPVPEPPPSDPRELAHLAIEKISSIDVQSNVTEYRTKDVPDAIDDTWIVSVMSRSQQELLAVQPTDKSLSVEGPFIIWTGTTCMDYFVLKGEPIKREIIYESYDDISNLEIPFWERHHFKIPYTIHEQPDGVYYAICATGTSSKDSLLSWIRCLEKTNPILEHIPIVFKLKSLTQEKALIEQGENKPVMEQLPSDTDALKE
ncbi:evolutionarily conserved signaling intermediate in Toll pathway, mitochondrial [Osmia lignaria lignaria]|uniref:evolutionarily conserved signaling intermediate in Toll pathway, mitochondrial n=1 Tax=Osmia lignaria lignaria TaxID=1437193 RepID=UPI00402BDDDC